MRGVAGSTTGRDGVILQLERWPVASRENLDAYRFDWLLLGFQAHDRPNARVHPEKCWRQSCSEMINEVLTGLDPWKGADGAVRPSSAPMTPECCRSDSDRSSLGDRHGCHTEADCHGQTDSEKRNQHI